MSTTLRWYAGLGAFAWALRFTLVRPGPFEPGWTVQLVLLAPLVLVPLALLLLPGASGAEARIRSAFVALHPVAALGLLAAFAAGPRDTAVLLALPWLLATACIAVEGCARLFGAWSRSSTRTPGDVARTAATIVFLPIGASWTVVAAGGARPIGFEDAIVVLTAAHFHYAGFLLPLFAAEIARARPGRAAGVACVGVVLGVPLTAAGITATQLGAGPVLECAAAVLTALAALLAGVLHVACARDGTAPATARVALLACGVALTFSSLLALAYGLRSVTGWTGLDIPWMRALHGTANALGFGLCGVLGWTLAADRAVRAGAEARRAA